MSDLLSPSSRTAKFERIGDVVKGVVLSKEEVQQRDFTTGEPKFWDDGKPMMQVVITLATDARDEDDDDGERKLYVKGRMLTAVREAIKAAKARTVEVGGTLAVKYVGDGEPPKRGLAAPKLYKAQYQAPELLSADDEVDPF